MRKENNMKNEKFKCTQCGNDELHVFNVPHSVSKSKVFYIIVTVLSAVSALAWGTSLAILLLNVKDFSAIWSSYATHFALRIAFNTNSFLISLALLVVFIAFLVRPAYEIKNVTEYYCPLCGKQEPIEEIYKKAN